MNTEALEGLIGTMLGDGMMLWPTASGARFKKPYVRFSHDAKYEDLLLAKRSFFEERGVKVGEVTRRVIPLSETNLAHNETEQVSFSISSSEESLIQAVVRHIYRGQTGPGSKRQFPLDSSLLTPLGLFWWFLDDGCCTVQAQTSGGKGTRRCLQIALKSLNDTDIKERVIPRLNELTGCDWRPQTWTGPDRVRTIQRVDIQNVAGIKSFYETIRPFMHLVPQTSMGKFCAALPEWENPFPCFETGTCTCSGRDRIIKAELITEPQPKRKWTRRSA